MIFLQQVVVKQVVVKLLLVGAVLGLVACGGGGGKKTPTPTPEPERPDDFSFTLPQTTYERGAVATTDVVTITGIVALADISITAGGEYSIDSGNFTSSVGQIANNQTLVVRATAGANFDDAVEIRVTVGSETRSFTVTTESEDTDPAPFELGNAAVEVAGQTVESEIITVTGINTPVEISINNGEFRILGELEYGSHSDTTVMVEDGDQVQVRVTAGSQINDEVTATLTIGEGYNSFVVSFTDRTPPTATVIFPTSNTMSNGSFVTLRGKASDNFGPVTQIQAIVTTDDGTVEVDNETITATAEDNFINTWSVRVNLATEKLNTIQVIATDAGGNIQETPVTLTVLQKADALTTNFPEGNDEHIGEFRYRGLAYNKETQTLYFPSYGSDAKILQLDIDTGTRSEFLPHNPDITGFAFMRIFPGDNALYFGDQNSADGIFRLALSSMDLSVVTDGNSPGSDVDINAPLGMRLGSNGDLYVVDAYDTFFSVNTNSGARELISSESRPNSEVLFDLPVDLWLDEPNNRALVSARLSAQLTWVDLDSGAREEFVGSDQLTSPFEMEPDEGDNRVILTDPLALSLLSVDLDTGVVTTISSTAVPEGGANSLQYPFGLAVDDENNIAFVVSNPDEGFSSTTGVLLIDANTGERIIVTNSVQ